MLMAVVSLLSGCSSLHRSWLAVGGAGGCLVQDIGPFGLLSAIDASTAPEDASISLCRPSAGWPGATRANTCGGPSSSFFVLNRRMIPDAAATMMIGVNFPRGPESAFGKRTHSCAGCCKLTDAPALFLALEFIFKRPAGQQL
uniref:Putative secreted peptide n=1 Tax=Anopheles braziliensis TaxID=58242 RepID=A0A2M3ZNG9_9DIPT